MPRLISHVIERRPMEEWKLVPPIVHGIYALLDKNGGVVYIGMARGKRSGVKSRLKKHSTQKAGKWTHFSILQTWDNIHEDEIKELEGILRHIYRFDQRAHLLAKAKSFAKFKSLTHKTFKEYSGALGHGG